MAFINLDGIMSIGNVLDQLIPITIGINYSKNTGKDWSITNFI
jgi:hypothetical protein